MIHANPEAQAIPTGQIVLNKPQTVSERIDYHAKDLAERPESCEPGSTASAITESPGLG